MPVALLMDYAHNSSNVARSVCTNCQNCVKQSVSVFNDSEWMTSLGYYLDEWTGLCTWPSGWLHLAKWLPCTWSSALTNWPLGQVPFKIWRSWQISFNSMTMGISDESVLSRNSREHIPRLFWGRTLVLIKLEKWQSTFWKAQEVL